MWISVSPSTPTILQTGQSTEIHQENKFLSPSSETPIDRSLTNASCLLSPIPVPADLQRAKSIIEDYAGSRPVADALFTVGTLEVKQRYVPNVKSPTGMETVTRSVEGINGVEASDYWQNVSTRARASTFFVIQDTLKRMPFMSPRERSLTQASSRSPREKTRDRAVSLTPEKGRELVRRDRLLPVYPCEKCNYSSQRRLLYLRTCGAILAQTKKPDPLKMLKELEHAPIAGLVRALPAALSLLSTEHFWVFMGQTAYGQFRHQCVELLQKRAKASLVLSQHLYVSI